MLMIIFSFFVLSSLAAATHPLHDVVAKSRILPHPSEVKIMSGTFPANPSYLIARFDIYYVITGTCDTTPSYHSYLLNTCISDSESSSSQMITCDGEVATITEYDGTTCETQSSVSHMVPGCQQGDSVYICGASSPYDYSEGEYLVFGTYETNSCTNLISATGLRSGICYPDDRGSSIVHGLTEYIYSTSGCTGSYKTSTISTACEMSENSDFYSSYSSVTINSSSGDDSGLSGGAIAGIVIAVLIVVAAVIAGVVYYIRKPSNSHTPVTTSDTTQVGNQMIGNWSVNL